MQNNNEPRHPIDVNIIGILVGNDDQGYTVACNQASALFFGMNFDISAAEIYEEYEARSHVDRKIFLKHLSSMLKSQTIPSEFFIVYDVQCKNKEETLRKILSRIPKEHDSIILMAYGVETEQLSIDITNRTIPIDVDPCNSGISIADYFRDYMDEATREAINKLKPCPSQQVEVQPSFPKPSKEKEQEKPQSLSFKILLGFSKVAGVVAILAAALINLKLTLIVATSALVGAMTFHFFKEATSEPTPVVEKAVPAVC